MQRGAVQRAVRAPPARRGGADAVVAQERSRDGDSSAGLTGGVRRRVRDRAREHRAERRRRLDAGAPLADEPPEARRVRILTHHRQAVRRERPQAGPGGTHGAHGELGGGGHALEGEGDVELLGPGVARLARRLVGRGHQQPAGLRLEVVAAGDVHHERPGGDLRRRRHQRGGAPHRQQSERGDAAAGGEHVAPRAGGVDEVTTADRTLPDVDGPPRLAVVDPVGRHRLGRREHDRPPPARTGEEALQEQRRVDRHRPRLVHAAAADGTPTEAGERREHLVDREAAHVGGERSSLAGDRIERIARRTPHPPTPDHAARATSRRRTRRAATAGTAGWLRRGRRRPGGPT